MRARRARWNFTDPSAIIRFLLGTEIAEAVMLSQSPTAMRPR